MRVSGMDFQREIPARVMRRRDDDETGSLEEYMAPLFNAGLLVFDELDKLSGSSRVCLEFFGLLNQRLESGDQPTVLITFLPPPKLVALFQGSNDKQLGRQIARRIDDYFRVIEMKKGAR